MEVSLCLNNKAEREEQEIMGRTYLDVAKELLKGKEHIPLHEAAEILMKEMQILPERYMAALALAKETREPGFIEKQYTKKGGR